MKKKFIGVGSWLLLTYPLFAQQMPKEEPATPAQEYAQSIRADDLAKHLRILASDSLQGRETGEPGQKMAADYIANAFFEAGLQPLVTLPNGNQSYFQPFELVKGRVDSMVLAVNNQKLTFAEDFLFLGGEASFDETLRAPLVFAGYGMQETNYSDYATVEVKDKIALIFLGEPKDKKGNSLLTGKKEGYQWTKNLGKKATLAREKGAKTVIFIDEQNEVFGNRRQTYVNYATESEMRFKQEGTSKKPFCIVSLRGAATILQVGEAKLRKQIARLAKKKKTKIKEVNDAQLRQAVYRSETIISTENVAGIVEGTDKKDEVIIITAHYDHLGKHDNVVYNGANDDGSGTVAVLELAQAFAQAKGSGNGPRRSILFMTVTGEEKGLLGSEYYTKAPLLPLEKTVANLNIDMIGRSDDAHPNNTDYIYVIGSDKLSSELHQISEEANRKYTQLNLDYQFNDPGDPNRFYYRSDHYNFAKHKIPVSFYFNGVHADYHQPTDDVEKINFEQAAKVARLVFYTAWELANREDRIKVDSNKP